jgi:hypothetical protein
MEHQQKRKLDCFVARAPLRKRFVFVAGNDGRAQIRILAARFARVLPFNVRPSNRGRRECRAPDAPAAACAMGG